MEHEKGRKMKKRNLEIVRFDIVSDRDKLLIVAKAKYCTYNKFSPLIGSVNSVACEIITGGNIPAGHGTIMQISYSYRPSREIGSIHILCSRKGWRSTYPLQEWPFNLSYNSNIEWDYQNGHD
jgi:hypothetical protein